MPKTKIDEMVERECKRLADEIALAYVRFTSSELMEIAIACNCSLKTLERYTDDVKKLAVGEQILAEMNKKLAARDASVNAA